MRRQGNRLEEVGRRATLSTAFSVLSAIATLVLVSCSWGSPARPETVRAERGAPRGRDRTTTDAYLAKIHRALSLYRQDYGVKPVDQWGTPSDAGLPPTLATLALPGHAWSLPGGRGDLVPPDGTSDPRRAAPGQLYPPQPWREAVKTPGSVETWGDYPTVMRTLGEKLPVAFDPNWGFPKVDTTIVLCLDGTTIERKTDQGSWAQSIYRTPPNNK